MIVIEINPNILVSLCWCYCIQFFPLSITTYGDSYCYYIL